MKKIPFLLFLAFASVLPARVTLSQAVADAWKISPGLDSQRLEEEAAATARLTALRQKYFSVFFNGSYRYSSDKVEVKASAFPFPLGPNIPAGTVMLSAPNDNFDLKMSLSQPLYSGGLLDNAVKMEAIREAAEKDVTRLKKIELAGQVKSSYFTYLLFCRKRDSLNSLLSSLDLHLRKVTNLFAEEMVSKSDLLESQAKADEIRLSLEDLEQLIAAEAVHFNSLCGYDPQDIDFQPGTGSGSFAAAREYFLAGHPLLRSLEQRERLVQVQKKSIAGGVSSPGQRLCRTALRPAGPEFFHEPVDPVFPGRGERLPARFQLEQGRPRPPSGRHRRAQAGEPARRLRPRERKEPAPAVPVCRKAWRKSLPCWTTCPPTRPRMSG